MENTNSERSKTEQFLGEVAEIINKLSLDSDAHIPDYLIAAHLWESYKALKSTVFENNSWHRAAPK